MSHLSARELIGATVAAVLFILSSWLVQTHLATIAGAIGADIRGMAIYVVVSVVSIVLAPVATLPLVPIASGLWGGFLSGLLNIVAWLTGAMIAFGLARTAGIRWVRKVVPLERLDRLEERIPDRGMFWTIVFLRIVIPVDILSYALGLFSRVDPWLYFWATLLGITPFAFILAYAGRIPFAWQLAGLFSLLAVVLLFWGVRRLIRSR